MTSDAMMSPAADGTNAVEPGTAFSLPAGFEWDSEDDEMSACCPPGFSAGSSE